MNAKDLIKNLLDSVDIKINGPRDYDIKVNNEKLYKRVLSKGSLGLGEAYMDGWWECKRLDIFFEKILRGNLNSKVKGLPILINALKAYLLNLQSKSRAFQIGKRHYDIGNDLYNLMLDKRMVYSCGYWKNAKTLDQAQENKLELICKKINLKKGDKILDIGCGWGSFAKYAAEKYKAKVVGITVSKEQAKLAKERYKGLDVEIKLQDYRELNEEFDHIISIGMFEHVGVKNYKTFMEVVNKNLKDEGLFLLHTIGRNSSVKFTDPWFNKYIFPNSMLPSVKQIADSSEGLFVLEDWHSFGPDYDKTLMQWHKNFTNNYDKIKNNYDERFHKMWEYYLLSSAGSFRARKNQLWQVVFSKEGIKDGYKSIR